MSKPTLEERAEQFHMLQLPGQPQMMHMGSSYLVHDLWDEIERLRDGLERALRFFKAIKDDGRLPDDAIDMAIADASRRLDKET